MSSVGLGGDVGYVCTDFGLLHGTGVFMCRPTSLMTHLLGLQFVLFDIDLHMTIAFHKFVNGWQLVL